MKRESNHTYKLQQVEEFDSDGNPIMRYKIENIHLNLNEVKNGIKITWLAEDTEFEIWFPRERNLISVPWYCRWRRIRSKNMRITRTIRGEEPGDYEYSIYSSLTENLAKGNSSPRMIVRQ
jgi:hypothetical protein